MQIARTVFTTLSVAVFYAAASWATFAQTTPDRGEPRDDIDRFTGLYRAEGEAEHRKWFVADAAAPYGENELPPGYLMIGAMWGDVAPWYMTSAGDTTFIRPAYNEWNPDIVVEFVTGPDEQATAYDITYGDEPTRRLDRVEDLPDDF